MTRILGGPLSASDRALNGGSLKIPWARIGLLLTRMTRAMPTLAGYVRERSPTPSSRPSTLISSSRLSQCSPLPPPLMM